MRKIFKSLAFVMTIAVSVGCNGLSDLENRVDVLESKVKALETVIDVLNDNVSTMQTLIQNSIPITSVSQNDGVYTLVFADGSSATLAQGTEGVGVTPVVSIDEEGYWTVDYGSGVEYIYADAAKTRKVRAAGADAAVPVFGVDASGDYWTVSTDGGKTFTNVTDGAGNPVPVVIEGDSEFSFFDEVSYKNDVFTVKLKDSGKVLEIPVISSFYYRISGSETVQSFMKGQTRTFSIEQKGVVATLLTLPEGWSGSLTSTTLTLTSPLATKSLSVDSSSEVSILATSSKGYAVVAKLKVEHYGNDHWTRYQAGKDVYVGGMVISKETYPGAVLITAPITPSKKGIYFLEPGVQQELGGGNPTQLMIIGRYIDQRSNLVRDRYLNIEATSADDYLVLANLALQFNVQSGETQKYMFTLLGNDNFENIVFENVYVNMPSVKSYLVYMQAKDSSPNRAMTGKIVMKDCDINLENNSGVSLIYSTFIDGKGDISSVEFTGNRISSESGSTGFKVLDIMGTVASKKMESNTLVNVTPAAGADVNIEN